MRVTIQPSELVEGGARLRQVQPTGESERLQMTVANSF